MNKLLLLTCSLYCSSSHAQTCTYPAIDSNSHVSYACKQLLQVNGKIDDSSKVTLTSMDGDIVIDGKIDAGSNVTITAMRGSVTIKQKIDNSATVHIQCRGDITIEGKIDGGAVCDFNTERGKIMVKDKVYNNGTTIRYHTVQTPAWGSSIDITPVAY